MREDIIIRCEEEKDFEEIRELILCSFSKGTPYSDGTSFIAVQ